MYFNGTKCCSLVLCAALSLPVIGKESKTALEGAGFKKPVVFVENKGQLSDQNNHPRKDIQYKLTTPGMTLFVGNGQMHYQFKKSEPASGDETPMVSTYRVDVSLIGANNNAKVVVGEQQQYFERYYNANAGADGIIAHSCKRIVYSNVYPNIDWVLYVKNDQVEYDFVVKPGGNAKDIRLEYAGATKLKIDADGSLRAETPMGAITAKTPFAYETATGREVASSFKLHDNVVSFDAGDYQGSLTIDPALSWSTYFGGAGQEVATCVSTALSPGLFTYVGGYATSAGLATGGGIFQAAFAGTQDAFLARYNSAGVVQFVTYFGGVGSSRANAVCLDNGASNVYLAGLTSSPAGGLTSPGAYHNVNNGAGDGFLIKFNTGGARQWCTLFGGTGADVINGVAVDASNNVYITGQTASASLVATGGAYQGTLSGANDAFIARFSSFGTISWSTYYGGVGQEQALGIVFDGTGHLDIVGQTNSVLGMASAGAYQTSLSGASDAFVAQFTTAGTRVWGTYFGGNATEQGNGIASDASGNLAIVGTTTSTTGLASAKAFQTAFGGVQDAFAAYLTNAGAVKWSSYYGGAALDFGQGVCFDRNGFPVIVGGAFSSSGIATLNSFQPTIGGDYDAFIAKITPMGQILWDSYFGGTFYDYANAVDCDQQNQLVMAGYTTSTGAWGAGGIARAGAAQPNNAGGVYDAFVTKFAVDTFLMMSQPFTDTLVCAGGTLQVQFGVGPTDPVFQPGNIFSLELSGPGGSWASPTVIGLASGTGGGFFSGTIPLTAGGTGYRVRVSSSNPVFSSPDNFIDITIVPSLTPTFASATTPACVGGTIALNDTAPYSIDSWDWFGPGGFFSAIQNPTISGISVTPAAAGTYSVTTTHNGCPPITSTVDVVVNSVHPPAPSVGVSTVCAGSTLMLTASPDTTAPGLTWHWSGPGGFTSTLQNPTIPSATTANAGTYYVNDNLAGCESVLVPDVAVVNPNTPVNSSITASPGYTPGAPSDTVCLGTMVTFTASAVNGGSTPCFQWYAGGTAVVGAISNTWSSSTLTDGEQVQCFVASSATCPLPLLAGSNIIKMNIIDNAPLVHIAASPGAHVTPGSTVVFHSAVYNGGTSPRYQWFKNGTAVAGATSSSYTLLSVSAPDTISLQVTSTMSCAVPDSVAMSNIIVAESNVGVTSIAAAFDGIKLFPNPNTGMFMIRGTLQSSSDVRFEVTDMLGQVLASGVSAPNGRDLNQTVSLSNVADGLYMLRLSQEGQTKSFRFSVVRQ